MVDMARKIGRCEYQIGVWVVKQLRNRTWEATADAGILGMQTIIFPSLEAAHVQLTGESRRD